MSEPVLLIRADASPLIGTGHVMRMIALCQAWQRRGGITHLLTWDLPPAFRQRLTAEAIQIHDYPLTNPSSTEKLDLSTLFDTDQHAQITSDLARSLDAPWVVADGYHYSTRFQRAITESGIRLAIITDYDYCEQWFCQLLVDQNPLANLEKYESAGQPLEKLLGTRYALLRNEFLFEDERSGRDSRQQDLPSSHNTPTHRRILLTLGGSDPVNATAQLLMETEQLSSRLSLRVIIGAANPNRGSLLEMAASSKHQVEVYCNVTNMAEQYQWADGIISSSSSSCWEWMYYGLTAGIVAIAENQLPIYQELVKQNIAIGLGSLHEPVDFRSLEKFIDAIPPLPAPQDRYRNWVDGHGADRLAAALDSHIWLRLATADDKKLYFDWANDAAVRENSLQTEAISWEQHCGWFSHQLIREDCRMLVAMRHEQPIGQIRFTKTTQQKWNVAFSVAAQARGQGAGQEIIRLGVSWMRSRGLTGFSATVKPTNPASARCFERLGWRKAESSREEETPNKLLFFELP